MEEILRCFIKDDQPDMNRQIEFIIKQLNSGTVSPIFPENRVKRMFWQKCVIYLLHVLNFPFIKLYNYVNFGKEFRSFNNIVNLKVCRN